MATKKLSSALTKHLQKNAKAFKSAAESAGESRGPRCPSGEYEVKCISCDEAKSNAGDPQIVWSWEILSGPYKGERINERRLIVAKGGLTLEMAFSMICRVFSDCDIECEEWGDLPEAMSECEGLVARLKFTEGDYGGDIRILETLGDGSTPFDSDDEEEEAEEEASEDDEEDSSEWKAGDNCIVDDGDEEPWGGIFVEDNGNGEYCMVKSDDDDQEYEVAYEHMLEPED